MSPWARDIFGLLCVGWLVFGRFGGLTCDFWAVFEKKSCNSRWEKEIVDPEKDNGNILVASPSASLRPFDCAQGRAVGRFATGLDAGLKPSSISDATAKTKCGDSSPSASSRSE